MDMYIIPKKKIKLKKINGKTFKNSFRQNLFFNLLSFRVFTIDTTVRKNYL